jgi:hypothetical protein
MQIIVFWHVATFNWSEQHCSMPGTCDVGCVRYIGGTKSGLLTRPGMEFF